MKKLVITLLSIFACGAAYALPIGNPAEASLLCDGLFWEGYQYSPCHSWCDFFSFRIGFYGDYVFNKHMEEDNSQGNDIESTKLYTNAGYIAVNFWNRLDLFGTLGATSLFMETGLGGEGGRFELETETDLSWSVGLRGTIWKCGRTYLGAEAHYFYTRPHISRITESADSSGYPAHNVDVKFDEWQIGAGVTHRIYNLVPYIALRWGRAHFDDDGIILLTNGETAILHSTESKNNWGYALGVTLIGCEKASLTVEGRFGGETAVYTNGQIRF